MMQWTKAYLCRVHEDFDQLFNPPRRLLVDMLFDQSYNYVSTSYRTVLT